jgi:hypothetical protein
VPYIQTFYVFITNIRNEGGNEIYKIPFELGLVDRFHRPVPKPVFIKPVQLSNRFIELVPFLNRFIGIGSVFEPVLLKKQFWNQFSQKYFKFKLNFRTFIDIFFIYLKPVS